MRSTTYNKVVNFFKVFSGFIIAVPLLIAGAVQAATMYSSGSLLQPNDVTSSHIRQNTILNEDISQTTAFTLASSTIQTIHAGNIFATSSLTTGATTTFNGVQFVWPSADGVNAQFLATSGSGALSWATQTTPQDLIGYFGTGTTTASTLDGTNTYFWVSKVGSVYTLTQDVILSSLTVNSGVTLNTAGYKVLGTNTLTNSGTIQNSVNATTGHGGNGGQGTGGNPGVGGAAGSAGTGAVGGTLTAGKNGGIGGEGQGGVGCNLGTVSSNGIASNPAIGANGTAGGNGGAGSSGSCSGLAGGTAGVSTAETVSIKALSTLTASSTITNGDNTIEKVNRVSISGATSYETLSISAGSGSGGGGGGGHAVGGGGGAGGGGGGSGGVGGIIYIAFPTIINNASSFVSSNGGNGGNGGIGATANGSYGGGGGGGAGGNGGIIFLVYKAFTNNGTIETVGGTGGTGGTAAGATAGANGTAGNTGKIFKVKING